MPPGYARYLGIGLQLAVTLLAGVFLGYFLDRKLDCLPYLTLGGSALGFAAGFYNLLRQLDRKRNGDIPK